MSSRVLAVFAAIVMIAAGTAFASAPARAEPDPAAMISRQMIVVSVPTASSTVATLTAYRRDGIGWTAVIGPTSAHVGALGVGVAADGVYRTPAGTFALDQAFGRLPNPGTTLPYFRATEQDWWDEDPASPTYNLHVVRPNSPGPGSENLYDSGPVYDYAVNIASNPLRIPGHASGIFLHVTDGQPTWGCVAIGRDQMRQVLRWLDPTQLPHITIGVNATAPSVLPTLG
ncbi:L,D-transpeptidase family protein [Gordonia jinhuaensis]|uniref:L,D-transpeptidase family protein n=1 Tax=Gordonia jinhuaensis TaxID=1517702 RepID=UPI0027E551AA|nr:L,D-transpeptidase family protein [Gordonia jinhuaensis]